MSSINISNDNVKYLCRSFNSLREVPEFSVRNDIDVHINIFFKRRDKFCGIRTALKKDFESPEEFIVYSFMIEGIPFHENIHSSLDKLKLGDCSNFELNSIYKTGEKIHEYFPHKADVKRSHIVLNNSELNWAFLEDETNYHSFFWSEADSKLFGRCA